jgi:hypothetical protein
LESLILRCDLRYGLFSGYEGVDGGFEEGVRVGRFRQRRVDLEEGCLYGLGLVRDEIDEVLVCYERVSARFYPLRRGMLTLQESLDVVQLAHIV